MKKAVTFRFDAALLESARHCAMRQNRTLTNFIETLVKSHVAASGASPATPHDPVLTQVSMPPTST